MKKIRRFLNWLFHRHDWTTIYSGTMDVVSVHIVTGIEIPFNDVPLCLERCTCGKERAYCFKNAYSRTKLDPQWVRLEVKRIGDDIPSDEVLRK